MGLYLRTAAKLSGKQHQLDAQKTNNSLRPSQASVTGLLAIIALFTLLPSATAWAGLYKCEDESGAVTYSDKACAPKQHEHTLTVGLEKPRSGPGTEVCSSIRELAAKMASAMLQGVTSTEIINALGGIGRVSPDTMEVLSYVYSFEGVPRVTESQVTGLTYAKCTAGGFSVKGPDESGPGGSIRAGFAQGSGFIVNEHGHVLTNQHVVDGCRTVQIRLDETHYAARLVHARPEIDLALVQSEDLPPTWATFSKQAEPRRGERVLAAGYPLQGMLSRQINITDGIISATAGPGEDRNVMQMTVPLQPGSSGGPVHDAYGLVTGVSVAKLSHLATLQRAGTLPENVNFAVKGTLATEFLRDHGIPFYTGETTRELSSAEIGDDAQRYTVLIECQQ